MINVLEIQAMYYKLGYEGKKIPSTLTVPDLHLWFAYRLGCEDRRNGRPSRLTKGSNDE